jgi:hypothetical protein
MRAADLLHEAYGPLITFAGDLDEQSGWTPTQLPGWAVRDLVFHLVTDAQRALVALAMPSHEHCDTDEISYWREWRPGTQGAQAGLRGTRIMASAWSSVQGPAALFLETARAVLAVARRTDENLAVSTQGHTMTVQALLRTVAIEATIHHLDLEPALSTRPSVATLAEVRRVLDALLGRRAPADWDDVRYARLGTGRLVPRQSERDFLGHFAERLPLFG